MITKFRAILELVGGGISGPDDGPLSRYNFHDDQTPPTEEEINAKVEELLKLEPMRVLRVERNQKLSETDWWAGQDLTMTQDQKNYRQALRDLPSTAEPQLDENGQLINVTWPTKPS
tara:strand:- start:83 stop:433 length:351 start_codon:yes stop_codon:yes gene_type:complete